MGLCAGTGPSLRRSGLPYPAEAACPIRGHLCCQRYAARIVCREPLAAASRREEGDREMQQRRTRRVTACLLVAVWLGTTAAASGGSVQVVISVGDLVGRVTFDQDGQNLLVTLENIAPSGATCPEEVLTGVYFDLLGLTSEQLGDLVRVRAVLTPGSVVVNPVSGDGLDTNDEVGAEYGFGHELPSGLPGRMVISAVGLDDYIGPPHLFPGENLWGPPSDAPDGLGYGIISGLGPMANAKVQEVPLVQNGVIFTLSGLPEGFVLHESPVHVQVAALNYGTEFNPVVPVPSAVWGGMMLLVAMGVVAGIRRRKLRRGQDGTILSRSSGP